MSGGQLSRGALSLYKEMMRESAKFHDFNFRHYAQRRVRDGFRSGRHLTGQEAEQSLVSARQNLELIKRQTTVSGLFNSGQKLSLEMSGKQ